MAYGRQKAAAKLTKIPINNIDTIPCDLVELSVAGRRSIGSELKIDGKVVQNVQMVEVAVGAGEIPTVIIRLVPEDIRVNGKAIVLKT